MAYLIYLLYRHVNYHNIGTNFNKYYIYTE